MQQRSGKNTAQKMKCSIKGFFSKCDQTRKVRIWSHLLKKSLMENFIFCAMYLPVKMRISIKPICSLYSFGLFFLAWTYMQKGFLQQYLAAYLKNDKLPKFHTNVTESMIIPPMEIINCRSYGHSCWHLLSPLIILTLMITWSLKN